MWTTVGRMVAVFVMWGAFFALLAARGVAAGRAEVAASVGAGLTLVAWGVLLSKRSERRAPEVPQQPQRPVPLEPSRERATV